MSIPRAHPLWGQTDGGSGVYGYDGRIEHNDLPRSPNADVYSQNEEDDRSIVFTPPPSLPFPLAQRTVSLSPTTPPLTQRSVTDQIDMDLTPSSPRDSTDIEEPWEDAEQTLSRCYSAQYLSDQVVPQRDAIDTGSKFLLVWYNANDNDRGNEDGRINSDVFSSLQVAQQCVPFAIKQILRLDDVDQIRIEHGMSTKSGLLAKLVRQATAQPLNRPYFLYEHAHLSQSWIAICDISGLQFDERLILKYELNEIRVTSDINRNVGNHAVGIFAEIILSATQNNRLTYQQEQQLYLTRLMYNGLIPDVYPRTWSGLFRYVHDVCDRPYLDSAFGEYIDVGAMTGHRKQFIAVIKVVDFS